MEIDEILKDHEEGRRLHIELGTTLLVQIEGVTSTLKGMFVGMRPNEYLIIELPKITGLGSKIFEGNQVVVRYVSCGVVYGFQSSIKGSSVNFPHPVVFLRYPGIIERMELRKHKRVQCYLPCTVRVGERVYTAVILDISMGGCRTGIEVNRDQDQVEVSVGDKVALVCNYFQVPGGAKMSGVVKNVRTDSSVVEMGIQFGKLDPTVVSELNEYINVVMGHVSA